MIGLTKLQRRLLEFIDSYIARNDGVSPSFVEMQHELGLASKSGVHGLIVRLEERGLIRRLPNRTRAIEVVTPLAVDLTSVPLHALLVELERRSHHSLRPDGAALPSGHNLPEPSTAPPAIGGSGPSVLPHHVSGIADA